MPNLAYATTPPGALYSSIGWFNFSSLPANFTVSLPQTVILSNTIKGGGTIQATFTISTNPVKDTPFSTMVPPTWAGAAFGNTAYLGITLPVCLRDNNFDFGSNYGIIDVNNISLYTKYGERINDFNLYFLDSETVDGTNPQTFTTNGGVWDIFYTLPVTTSPTCGLSGVGTTIVNTVGSGNCPVLTTTNPTSIIQTLARGGAMTFGLSLTSAETIKVVTNRIDPSDQFMLEIIGPSVATTITAGQSTGVQAQGLQVISSSTGYFVFDETMAPGSASPLSYYSQTVQLSNSAIGGTTLPDTIALGTGVTLNFGDTAVMTIINSPIVNVSLNKTVDKNYSNIGETLTYTLVVSNSSAFTINNIVVSDTVPTGTSYVSSSLKLNGITILGNSIPDLGIDVGNLPSGSTSTIMFKVTVQNTLPSPNTIINNATAVFPLGSVNSQSVVTTINTVQLTSSKLVNLAYANVGDVLTYTIPLINLGNTTANNVVFLDTIPNNTTLVANSFKQDGAAVTGSPNAPGTTLPSGISSGTVSTVTFQVVVDTIPSPNPITNSASTNFSYTVDPSIVNGASGSTNTNSVTTQVNNANLSKSNKFVNMLYADCGDILTYIIVIPNSGNITAENVIFYDTIPSGTNFISNSVTVNGVTIINYNPVTGITIPDIGAGHAATVTFSVMVQC